MILCSLFLAAFLCGSCIRVDVYAEELPVIDESTEETSGDSGKSDSTVSSAEKKQTAASKYTPKGTKLYKVYGERKRIRVEWKARKKKVDGYQIRYSTTKRMKKNVKSVRVRDLTQTSRTIRKLEEKKNYYVQIRTWRKVKGKKYYSDWSDTLRAKTLSETAPKAPELKSADWASGSQVSVRWTAVSGASGYEVYRSRKKYGDYTKIADMSGYSQVRSIVSAPRSKVYYYMVRAYAVSGGQKVRGEASNIVKCVKYKNSNLGELFPDGPPTSAGGMQQYLTNVTVPIRTAGGGRSYMTMPIHRKLVKRVQGAFEDMYNAGFVVKRGSTWSYVWRSMRTTNLMSHHSYGCVVDINWDDNPMTSFYQIGNGEYRPGSNPYAITQKIVKIWNDHGFYWGGDWTEKKDYMHMTYTNN